MRIVNPPFPDLQHVSVVYLDELKAWVLVDFRAGTLCIRQPRHLGGEQVWPLDAYDVFDGDVSDFVLAMRGQTPPPLKAAATSSSGAQGRLL